MKYYHELCSLESVGCDLKGIIGILDALTTACEEMDSRRLQDALYNVVRQLEMADEQFNNRFTNLFETVRDDTHEESKPRKKRKPVRKNSE